MPSAALKNFKRLCSNFFLKSSRRKEARFFWLNTFPPPARKRSLLLCLALTANVGPEESIKVSRTITRTVLHQGEALLINNQPPPVDLIQRV